MKEMRGDINKVGATVEGLRGLQKAIIWLLGSLLVLIGIAGTWVATGKTLNWF